MKNWNHIEQDLYNSFLHNKEHVNCPLIIKCGYNNPFRYGLYCHKHDKYFRWLSDDPNDIVLYKQLGINKVIYPQADNDMYMQLSFDCFEHPWAFDLNSHKMIEIINYKTEKKIKMWIALKGDPHRDPSMSQYWKFIDSFVK